MDCNVGNQIPSSQVPTSPSLSTEDHHPHLVQRRPDLPPGTAGTAGDPRGNMPEVQSVLLPCC